ncbi:MAG: hypothetical protein ABW116_06290 [Candidatus Sedimenticola sp. 20ELBAFRAG]
MNALRPGLLLTLLLLAVNALAATLLISQWADRENLVAVQTGGGESKSNSLENDIAKLPGRIYTPPEVGLFAEILERPLFVSGRLPPEQPQEIVSSGELKAKLSLALEGVAITPKKRVAIFRDQKSREFLRLPVGAKHQGWTVDEIKTSGVVMKRGAEIHELPLEIQLKSQAAKRSPAFKLSTPKSLIKNLPVLPKIPSS